MSTPGTSCNDERPPGWRNWVGSRARNSLAWGLAALLAIVLLVWRAPSVCSLLLASFIIAYACAPLVDLLERRRVPRALAAALVLLLVILVVLGMITLLVPVVIAQGQALAQQLPYGIEFLTGTLIPWVESTFRIEVPETSAGLTARLREYLPRLGGIVSFIGGLAVKAFGGVLGIAGAIANLVLVPFLAFNMLRGYHSIWPGIESLIPSRYVARVRSIINDIDAALSGFIRGQLTVALILGVMLAIGLSIVRIDGAIVIGLMSGFLNMVPYLGTGIGITLSLLMAILKFAGWGPIIGVLVVFAITQSLEGYVITPRIVGERVGLPPIAVVVAVLAGGEIFGFVGILLAVPMAAILKVLLGVARQAYLSSNSYGLDEAEPEKPIAP